jgi:rhodanese-related sulfurtransferase
MAKEQLKTMMGNPDLIIVDVRTASDWNSSDMKIQKAVREDSKTVNSWANKYPKDKTLVFYCAWLNEGTSASVALQMMEKGYTKVYALKGGWNEWVKAKFPTEKKWSSPP